MRVLPQARVKGTLSVEEALAKRRSVRAFLDDTLTLEQLSQILWAAGGITEAGRGLRAAPSAGGTYPLEIYLSTPGGVFHYVPAKHVLADMKKEDIRAGLGLAALAQPWITTAPAIVILAAVPERTMHRYGERGRMYIHMEAGHVAQSIHLQAVAIGLGSVPVGAFNEAEVAKLIGLPPGETPVYLIAVGTPVADEPR